MGAKRADTENVHQMMKLPQFNQQLLNQQTYRT
jgi:hypothetical protein